MPDRHTSEREVLSLRQWDNEMLLISPIGLERGLGPDQVMGPVTLDQLRWALDRYSARKTTVPGSYAHRHYVETGHVLRFGCCAGTGEAAA